MANGRWDNSDLARLIERDRQLRKYKLEESGVKASFDYSYEQAAYHARVEKDGVQKSQIIPSDEMPIRADLAEERKQEIMQRLLQNLMDELEKQSQQDGKGKDKQEEGKGEGKRGKSKSQQKQKSDEDWLTALRNNLTGILKNAGYV